MKKIQKLIIIVIIIIIIMICGILILLKNSNSSKKDSSENIVTEDYGAEDGKEYEMNKKFKEVSDVNIYFSVKNILSEYVTHFENINKDTDVDVGRMQITEEELKNEMYSYSLKAINNTFDEEYLKDQKKDEKSIKEYVSKYKNNSGNAKYIIEINEMYQSDIDKGNVVLVYSKINNIDFNTMLKINWEEKVYSVFWDDYLEKNDYTKTRSAEISLSSEIKKNEYNYFVVANTDKTYICIQYFEDLKNKIKNSPEKIFNMLDDEYRKVRFPTKELYDYYITDISSRVEKMNANKYKFGENEIIILDNYNSVYTFKISGILDYKVQLDNYSIESNEIKEEYANANDQEKVYANIEKIFMMANAKDYNGIYNKLDTGFKNNKFKTYNDLRESMKKNLYDYNRIEKINSFEKKGEYYIVSVSFYNGELGISTRKSISFIIKLINEDDFIMSFSYQ